MGCGVTSITPVMDIHPPDWNSVQSALKQYWGYDNLRSPQDEVIQTLLLRRDALVVLPTGMGKSLCFQLPAILGSGLTLVVSPLIALMENQVQELQAKRLPAALLHSQLSASAKREGLRKLEQGSLRLLYLAPETLLSPPVWERLCCPNLVINSLMIDEAHCLVQWGESFRPAYQRLGAVRPALLSHKPSGTQMAIAAFTATADPNTQKTIQNSLQLQQPVVIKQNPYRANLSLSVQMTCTPRDRRGKILRWLRNHTHQSGLVYVRSRRETEAIAAKLQEVGLEAEAYHAGLASQQRRQVEQSWLKGDLKIVVCTSAFGLGINKPDCRWVVHYQPPLYLSEYLQEIGRAGRDGKPAHALLLRSEPTGWLDPSDRQQRQFFIAQLQKSDRKAQNCLRKLPSQGNITELKRQVPEIESALGMLQRTGQIRWLDPFQYQVQSTPRKPPIQKGQLDLLGLATQSWQTQALEAMTQFLSTSECRWRFLLRVFGFQVESENLTCGHCDNCCRRIKAK